MEKIYLDNAATTPLRLEVVEAMSKVLLEDFGNPSSSHSFGRKAKNNIELSRKNIAKILNASAQEIIFTSSGTEAINWILRSAVVNLKVLRIITSRIEHHAVLHAVDALQNEFDIDVDFVRLTPDGAIDLTDLASLLSEHKPTLVSLMHVNNEIGTVLDLSRVATICKEHQAYFHTDTVQSVGKTTIDLQAIPIDFIVSSAHKFHGPKGIGFAFVRKGLPIKPLFYGGEQEKGLRAGTESVHNIVGMSFALELAQKNLDTEQKYITELKDYCLAQLMEHFPDSKINGGNDTFYNLLNVRLPFNESKTALILFHLDMKGVAVSRGSACQSGSAVPSHVLAEILNENEVKQPSLRISFSHFNKKTDIDYLISVLKSVGTEVK